MKNVFIYVAMLVSGLFIITSCEKDPIGNTATVEMAGEWYVTADAVDADGEVVYEDFFGLGMFHFDTYNTSANKSTEMWVDDHGNLWEFKAKVIVDMAGMSFQAADAENIYYDSQVTITNGKILYGAATTPSGSAADSIVFNVTFNDDTYPEDYGFASYRVAGFRYTGLEGDN